MWCSHVRDVLQRIQVQYDHDPADVKDEIFDMVTPKEPGFITLQDLERSNIADTICAMLVDGLAYLDYDQREGPTDAQN
jgi:hypothetical protein